MSKKKKKGVFSVFRAKKDIEQRTDRNEKALAEAMKKYKKKMKDKWKIKY